MISYILNNDYYMNLLKRLDDETFRKVLKALPGNQYEKVEVLKRITRIKRDRIIVHIPHSSLNVPDVFKDRLKVDIEQFNKNNIYESDYLIHEFKPNDLDCLIFPYSRMFCDVERYRNDDIEVMAKLHRRGVVYEVDSDKNEYINVDSNYIEEVKSNYYDLHHKKLLDYVKNKLLKYGECLIIDLHSYSDSYENKTSVTKYILGYNPDICIGFNDYETSKELIIKIQRLCNKYGYTNTLNNPYEGSIIPLKYMNNKRVKSVMLEINKRIYLNDELNELDYSNANKLKRFMDEFYQVL